MNTMVYYLGSLALFGFSSVLFRGTSPFLPIDCSTYERRRARRVVGVILLIGGALVLGIGLLAQFFSGGS